VHLPGMSPAMVRDQIALLAGEVVPGLRARLGTPGTGSREHPRETGRSG
jgi:hypothetical protein